MNRNRKPLIIGILCTLVMIMAVGFALLSENLSITGTSNINSNWNIKITNIEKKSQNGIPTETNSPTYTDATASFNVGFTTPGDYITYEITVENLGTLDAILDKIEITKQNSGAIIYTINGIKEGNSLLVNKEKKFTIKIEYNSEITSQPTKVNSSISLNLLFKQNLTNTINNDTEEKIVGGYDYEIGDVITFAGSNWYVIKNSPASEDYVVLLKEKVLTGTEIGSDYLYGGNTAVNYMAYYWSSTCHGSGTYGNDKYTSYDDSGCSGHNDYAGSKVREMLESTYLPTMDENNLKEIGGYKIRLIENEDVNFDYNWINHDFGGSNYWTMTTYQNYSLFAWFVSTDTRLHNNSIYLSTYSVRPVINLYKSAIGN